MLKLMKITYGICFLALLLVPSFGLWGRFDTLESCEKRTLSQWPTFEWSKEYFSAFETYFKEHFAFRNLATHTNSYLKYSLFKSSAKPADASLGKEDWFFYSSRNDYELDSYTHRNLLSDEELNTRRKDWEWRKHLLKEQGIAYYMAVWPNKSTIYEAYMPKRMKRQKIDTLSRVDQVKRHLAEKQSSISLIDVRQKLSDRAKMERIYHKHDAHWNDLGAFYAYETLMETLQMEAFKMEDFNIIWQETNKGDLLGIMGLCNSTSIKEQEVVFQPKDEKHYIERIETDVNNMYLSANAHASSNKTILVFRDSFTSAMVQFISLHFKKAYFVWTDYQPQIVEDLKPDIVIVAKVERYF